MPDLDAKLAPGLPKYKAVAQQLEDTIANATYRVGDRLPSERELAEQWGITAMTVRQAMEVLRRKSLIVRRQGQGTFVAATPADVQAAANAEEEGRITSGPGAARPIYLLGLTPTQIAHHSRVNWQPRLRRFQGLVDAAFARGVTIRSDVEVDPTAPPARLVEALSASAGLILHEELLPVEVLAGLAEKGVPMVAIDCYTDVPYCARILVDARRAALSAVKHLTALGHQRIAILTGDTSRGYSHAQRLAGYRDAHRLLGLPLCDAYIVAEPEGSSEAAAAACRALLALPEPPTAIFAVSDRRAIGVLEAAAELGIRVPQDLSVIGYDDLPEAAATTPPLTTLHNPLYESGLATLDLLLLQAEDPATQGQLQHLTAPLVVRKSTAAPHPA